MPASAGGGAYDNGQEVIPGPNVYQTDQLAWETRNAIRSAQQASKPFFIVYAPTVPHVEPDLIYQEANDGERDVVLDRPDTAAPYDQTSFNTYTDTWSQHIRGRLTTSTIPDGITFSATSPSIYGDPAPERRIRQWVNGHWEPVAGQFDLPRMGASAPNGQPVIGENLSAVWKPFWLRGFGNTRNPLNTTYSTAPQRPSITSADINRLKRLHLSPQELLIALDDSLGYLFLNTNILSTGLIILTSDNGYQLGEHNLGQKIFPYEELIRVPLIIRDPYNLNTSATPRIDSSIVLNTDIAPTIAHFTKGWTIGRPGSTSDGRSLMPFINTSYGSAFHRNRALI